MEDIEPADVDQVVEESAPVDESAPADLSDDLDRLSVIEAELTAAEAELDALDAAPSSDPGTAADS